MRKLVAAGAFASTVLSLIVLLALGLFLAGFEQTGARGAGVLLIACATVAFGAFLFLALTPPGYFGGRRRPLGVLVTFVAVAPAVALAWAALYFTGLPVGTSLPLMDWSVFFLGLGLALGGICVLALGYGRVSEAPRRVGRHPDAAEPVHPDEAAEIRVRRV